jgi:hypothetical protein
MWGWLEHRVIDGGVHRGLTVRIPIEFRGPVTSAHQVLVLGRQRLTHFRCRDSGKVAVVAQAPLTFPVRGGETVPIAVRNNTPGSVTEITAQGIVRDAGGKIVATGTDQGFHPALLQLGQVALGFIYLGIGTNVPAGSTITVQASGKRLRQ